MNEHDLYRAIGNVGDDLIAETAHRPIRKSRPVPWRTLAACLALVLLCGAAVGGYAMIYTSGSYRTAAAFFEEHDLPADGLSRHEIQEVYQDIEQQTFSHPKTAELFNILSYRLYMAPLAASDPDTLKAFWENRTHTAESSAPSVPTGSIRYVLSNQILPDNGVSGTSYWWVYCYDGETPLWKYSLPMGSNEKPHLLVLEDGILVYERITRPDDSQGARAGALRLSGDGKLLWEYDTHELGSHLDTAILEGDELVFFGCVNRDGNETLYVRLDLRDGRVLQTRKTRLDGYSAAYRIAIPLRDDVHGDGYLLENSDGQQVFISPSDGNAVAIGTARCTYPDGTTYHIMDLITQDDRVFLLGYRYIDPEKDAPLLQQVRELEQDDRWESNAFGGIVAEEYTAIFRSLFTTALLVSEADGTLRPVYTATGAAPSEMLSLDGDGHIRLSYDQLNIATPPHPAISAGCFMAEATQYQLIFDAQGCLLSKIEQTTAEQRWFY